MKKLIEIEFSDGFLPPAEFDEFGKACDGCPFKFEYDEGGAYCSIADRDNACPIKKFFQGGNMKKLFISQPMKGKTNDEILAVRQKAIQSAKRELGEDVEVIDSFFQDAPVDAKPLWFLGKSLELLATADVAFFAKGWEEARGCRIENTCAIEYGIDVIEDYTE